MPCAWPISASEPVPEVKRTLTPREAYADAEERLRPRRVVAVDEDRLGAVDRERLGVGDEAVDGELEVPPLLDRALRHHARAGRSASRRGARSRSAARSGRRRRSSRARRTRARAASAASAASSAGFSFRFVTCAWFAGRPPRAQLLEREHHLDRVEAGRRRARAWPGVSPRASRTSSPRGHVDVDEHAGELEVGRAPSPRRRPRGRSRARRGSGRSRRSPSAARRRCARRRRSRRRARAPGRSGPFAATSPSSGSGETSSSRRSSSSRARRSAQSRAHAHRQEPPLGVDAAASRTKAAVSGASQLARAGAPSPRARRRSSVRAQRRVDLEHSSSGTRGELGRPVEVVGELARGPPRARPRPGGAASPASRAARRRTSGPRGRPRASPRRARCPAGRRDEIRRRVAERVVGAGSKPMRPDL